jgi:shikimate kinase
VLSDLALVRDPIYALAPVHIVSNPAPHESTVNAILKAIRS